MSEAENGAQVDAEAPPPESAPKPFEPSKADTHKSNGDGSSGSGGSSVWTVGILACLFGVAVAAIPLGIKYNDCKSSEKELMAADKSKNTCWKPLFEMDGHGFLFAQQPVAGYMQDATSDLLVMTEMPDMNLAPGGEYDYGKETEIVLENLRAINSQQQKDEIAFFDGKLNIGAGIIGTFVMFYGFSAEQFIFHVHGETTALYDAGIAVWKNKLMHSRIRPTSVIQRTWPEETFTINDGKTVKGKNFEATVRVMPHSEYPSGSSCVCLAIKEFIDVTWPRLELRKTDGGLKEYDEKTAIIISNEIFKGAPVLGGLRHAPGIYTSAKMSQRCGETREEGGIHFTPAVPAGRDLCEGMGTTVGGKLLDMVPGSSDDGGKTVQEIVGTTPACAADCCADAIKCNATEIMKCEDSCKGQWDFPWFDLVDAIAESFEVSRERATSSFFKNVNRHVLTIMELQASTIPTITMAETIYHFRYTSILDNILWDAVASNSPDLLTVKFGRGKTPQNPTVRSGVHTTDARIVTGVHATAAAVPDLLPGAEKDFMMSRFYKAAMPKLGWDEMLVAECGAPLDPATEFDEDCLRKWYELNGGGPAKLGQIIAYEIMYHRMRNDGFNAMGTADGCDAGPHFCPRYNDYTGYDPEVGRCLEENLMDTLKNFDEKMMTGM